MYKIMLFMFVLFSTESNIEAMGPESKMLCPDPTVLRKDKRPSLQEVKRLQATLNRCDEILELLQERCNEGHKGPMDDIVRKDCLEHRKELRKKLRAAKGCCVIN